MKPLRCVLMVTQNTELYTFYTPERKGHMLYQKMFIRSVSDVTLLGY
jgi:hypothetical protein